MEHRAGFLVLFTLPTLKRHQAFDHCIDARKNILRLTQFQKKDVRAASDWL